MVKYILVRDWEEKGNAIIVQEDDITMPVILVPGTPRGRRKFAAEVVEILNRHEEREADSKINESARRKR